MISKTKDIIAVGSIAIDNLETPKGNQNDVLGGSAMYFSLSASLFTSIKLVGIVGNDYPQKGWDVFKSRNINIENTILRFLCLFSAFRLHRTSV